MTTKSKVSAMVSGAGMAANVWTRLDNAVKAKGGVDDDLHLLAREEGQAMIEEIAGMLVRVGAATRNVYPLTVDYSQSLADMIAAGKYDWKNDDITAEHFTVTGTGTVNLDVIPVHLNRDISTKDAEQELANLGLEPAKIEHLLAFGAKYPEIQREYPVIALGSSWVDRDGDCCVPCLSEDSEERDLGLDWTDDDWDGFCRFLAVRKVS